MNIPSLLKPQWLYSLLIAPVFVTGGAFATSGNPQTQPDTQSLCGTPHRFISLVIVMSFVKVKECIPCYTPFVVLSIPFVTLCRRATGASRPRYWMLDVVKLIFDFCNKI